MVARLWGNCDELWQHAASSLSDFEGELVHSTQPTNQEQVTLWNGFGGRGWVQAQEVLDRMLRPLESLLVEAVTTGSHARVLDVGCGTGSTTLACARLIGRRGIAMGVDISEPMLAVARQRAERESTPVSFIRADAQTHAFSRASFDLIVSRLGVMFFDDSVAAFTNLRRAVPENGELRVITWRSAAENPFLTAAERAATPLLPEAPARAPDAPGPFALADRSRIEHILEESGWVGIDVRATDVACALPVQDLVQYFTWVGPVGRILQQVDDGTRQRIIEVVRPAFDQYVHEAELRFTAACWMVSARAPAA
jgi:SAM-dependent methyltransferase